MNEPVLSDEQVAELLRGEIAAWLHDREPWLNKHQLAEHYACSIRSIQLALAAGMPSKKIFGKVKFRLSLVEPWLEAHGYLIHHGSDRSSTVIAHSIERADGA